MTKPAYKIIAALVSYDQETGGFTRSSGKQVTAKPGSEGYCSFRVAGTTQKAHRLAWLLMTGDWPVYQIDHINGNRSDNRWVNLRQVTNTVNCQNQTRAKSNSLTGYLGVRKNGSKFQAAIYVNKVCNYLGTFKTPEAAHAAYLQAKRVLHPGNTL